MDKGNAFGRLISEEVFYKSVVILLVGLPVVELFTEIIGKFNEEIIPSFFQPQVISLFGILGTICSLHIFRQRSCA